MLILWTKTKEVCYQHYRGFVLNAGMPDEYKVSSNFTVLHVNTLLHCTACQPVQYLISYVLPAGRCNSCSRESPAGIEGALVTCKLCITEA
jgi:hypothetical protein